MNTPRQTDKPLGWRSPILREFSPEIATVARITIVADPDELLSEEQILGEINRRGFDIIPFDDHVAFRYAYESKYRQAWDKGEQTNLVVILRSSSSDFDSLPYDLLQQARRDSRLLAFSLGDLFPRLSPRVVVQLDRVDLDALYDAQQTHQPGTLGENATKDFILLHVFGIAPQLIRSDSDLLAGLLPLHYQTSSFPSVLANRFVELLRKGNGFSSWALEEIVGSREAFFSFLQERWPAYLQGELGQEGADTKPELLRVSGPTSVPFGHDRVRVYIDNLFIEGYLKPTDRVSREAFEGKWQAVGVAGDAVESVSDRFNRLSKRIVESIPDQDAGHTAWMALASRWAEWNALRHQLDPDRTTSMKEEVEKLQARVEDGFAEWLLERYGSLHNLSYLPKPVMLHQVASYAGHGRDSDSRVAIIVIDGLALDQWVVLRDALPQGWLDTVALAEDTIFAWIPTLTSFSRQAIFAGKPPFYFASSVMTTNSEEKHWRRFWEDRGLRANSIAFIKQKKAEASEAFNDRLAKVAEDPRCRVLGVVMTVIDEMIHGLPTGSGGLHAQVRHWASTGAFCSVIDLLIGTGFSVLITSDHGNIEAEGVGKPNAGSMPEERGERAFIFTDVSACKSVSEGLDESLIWPPIGLPEDTHVLLAGGSGAFVPVGQRRVSHGGISIEEVVVPLVGISRRK